MANISGVFEDPLYTYIEVIMAYCNVSYTNINVRNMFLR